MAHQIVSVRIRWSVFPEMGISSIVGEIIMRSTPLCIHNFRSNLPHSGFEAGLKRFVQFYASPTTFKETHISILVFGQMVLKCQ